MNKELFLSKISTFYNGDLSLISKGYDFCKKYHEGQMRKSGDPYFTHPVEVACELAKMDFDQETIISGLLHDTIEDTKLTKKEIEIEFSKEIAEIVDGVTKLDEIRDRVKFSDKTIKQSDNFRKLFLALSKDIRVLIVKLVDRLHNMRTLASHKTDRQQAISLETLEIFAPLAEKIGLQAVKNELYDISFSYLYQKEKEVIEKEVQKLKSSFKYEGVVEDIIEELCKLLKENNLNCKIFGREKSSYAIWQKVKTQNISFYNISDVIAFRVITNSVEDCYKVLFAIHTKYHAMPRRFVDYISTPKPNNYQSIHTSIIGPMNYLIEIQIRTEKMHLESEYGLAVHWKYKQNKDPLKNTKLQSSWLKRVLKIVSNTADPLDLIEGARNEINYEKIHVIDENGNLIEIKSTSTILDYATFVIGLNVRFLEYAIVDGKIVNYDYILENGEQVKLILSSNIILKKDNSKHCTTQESKNIVLLALAKL